MFSKFSSVLHQAVEAFSSVATPEQDFITHWKGITSYFLENKEHKVSIEHTLLGRHLKCMFESLQQDDDREKTGPCLEYVLQHKILDTLATLARTDTPPGMKQEVLLFFTKLLSRLQHPLLPHVHVHKPVQRLVRLCGEQRAGPTEAEEIRFLCTLCAQLKAQPHLVGFFIESTAADPHSPCNGQTKPAVTHQPGSSSKQTTVFPLVSSLLSLMHSHDARVAVKSCEGLMLICSLRPPACSQAIVQCTDLARQLAGKMAALYRSVPRNLAARDVEGAQAKWGFDVHVSREDDRYFPGKQQLLSLLSWLDYCDQLVSTATPHVATEVALHVRKDFLSTCFKQDVLQTSESGAITSTSILTRCLYCVHSKPLVSEFCQFLLADTEDVTSSPSTPVSVRQRLIDRCNHLSDQVSLCTLKLFDTLLLKSDAQIFHTLVLQYLAGGRYKVLTDQVHTEVLKSTETPAGVPQKQVSDAEDMKVKVPLDIQVPTEVLDTEVPTEEHKTEVPMQKVQDEGASKQECTGRVLGAGVDGVTVSDAQGLSGTEEKAESPEISQGREGGEGDGLSPERTADHTASDVHRIVNSFLQLVPEEIRSSTEAGDTGYDTYLRDAHTQYSNTCLQCKDFQWSMEPRHPDSVTYSNADSNGEESAFYEGDFLKMLLDRLSRILDQSYELNLQLTSVLSKLCLLPHAAVHEYLLDTRISPQTRTLHSVLTKVSLELGRRVDHVTGVKSRLHQVRTQLSQYNQDVNRPAVLPTCVEGGHFLAAVITLEEFCKELAAIAFVKQHQL